MLKFTEKIDRSIRLVDGQNIGNAATVFFVKRALYGYRFGLCPGVRFAKIIEQPNDSCVYQYMNSLEVNDVFVCKTKLPFLMVVVCSQQEKLAITLKKLGVSRICPHENNTPIIRGPLPSGTTYQFATASTPEPTRVLPAAPPVASQTASVPTASVDDTNYATPTAQQMHTIILMYKFDMIQIFNGLQDNGSLMGKRNKTKTVFRNYSQVCYLLLNIYKKNLVLWIQMQLELLRKLL